MIFHWNDDFSHFWKCFSNQPIEIRRFLILVVLAKICSTRIPEFVRPEKNRVRTRIFRPNFQSAHYIFYISIVRTRFWPEFTLVRIVRPKKNRVSDINCSSEFWHCPNCPTRIWPEPEFLPALIVVFILAKLVTWTEIYSSASNVG